MDNATVRHGSHQHSVGLKNAPHYIQCEAEEGCDKCATRVTQDGQGKKFCPYHAAGKLTQAIR